MDKDKGKVRTEPEDGHAEWEPSATPVELRTQTLLPPGASGIQASPFTANEVPGVNYSHQSGPEVRPVANVQAMSAHLQAKIEMKPERFSNLEIIEVPIARVDMRAMLERRTQARPLGWKVPGLRIRPE